MTRIFIGYNEKFIFDSIHLIYSEMSDVQVIGGVENDKLLESFDKLNFNILLIELGQIRPKELDFISNVKQCLPEVSLFLLTSKIPPYTVSSLINHQPDGLMLKSCSKNDLINATKKIIEGEKYYCHKITQMLYSDMLDERDHKNHCLTKREEEILLKLVLGETNFKIASDLNISETTVKTHKRNIMHKLGASNNFALLRYACKRNLIPRVSDKFCKECPCLL